MTTTTPDSPATLADAQPVTAATYLVKMPAGAGLYRTTGITSNPSRNFASGTAVRFVCLRSGRAYRLIGGHLHCVDANGEPAGV